MSSENKQILTTDGIPLEVSLKKAEKKNKIKAFLLVAPLLLFLVITYIFPIAEMFTRSIDDRMITNMLPKTFKAIENWDGQDLPDEPVYKGLYEDLKFLKENNESKTKAIELLSSSNPEFIMRTHLVEKSIVKATEGDFSDFEILSDLLINPYEMKEKYEAFYKAPTNKEVVHKTFCGT